MIGGKIIFSFTSHYTFPTIDAATGANNMEPANLMLKGFVTQGLLNSEQLLLFAVCILHKFLETPTDLSENEELMRIFITLNDGLKVFLFKNGYVAGIE